jgi:hypothetical protein
VSTCLIEALIAAVFKVGGFIGIAAAEDWNQGRVLEARGVLEKMIPIRRKTGIRAKEALDPILHVSPRARFDRWISDDCYRFVKLLKTLVALQVNMAMKIGLEGSKTVGTF